MLSMMKIQSLHLALGAVLVLGFVACADDSSSSAALDNAGENGAPEGAPEFDSGGESPETEPDGKGGESPDPADDVDSASADPDAPDPEDEDTDDSGEQDGGASDSAEPDPEPRDTDGPRDTGDSGDSVAERDAREPTDGGAQDTVAPDDASPGDATEGEDAESPEPAPVWDPALVADATTANCQFTDYEVALKDGVLLDTWRVSYTSYELIEGELSPILIRGYAARPSGESAPLPGVVQAHGLGGYADLDNATGPAALTGTFVLAYTGPGGGTSPENQSEGLPAGALEGYRMFNTVPDPRGSWFWGHATAAMRGITCLENRPDVDPNRLGITGYSAGGVVTLIAASVDPRVDAAVALSGTGMWGEATKSPDAWQHNLLTEAGLDTSSAEWNALLSEIEPGALLGGADTPIWIVNGTSDEFFPITSHVASLGAAAGAGAWTRHSLVGNYDHGCYALTGGESAATIEDRASLRATGAQRALFRHVFGMDATYAQIPAAPTMTATAVGAATLVSANIDVSVPGLDVVEVKYWWSNDDAFLWGSSVLEEQGPGLWGGLVVAPLVPNTVAFVDVEYSTSPFLALFGFSLSSNVILPVGFVPHIRSIDSCL